jgi:hypothetical protein
MKKNLVITTLLYILEKIPYRTKLGLSLADELKYFYYVKIGYKKERCLCGGIIQTYQVGYDGWSTECTICGFLADED